MGFMCISIIKKYQIFRPVLQIIIQKAFETQKWTHSGIVAHKQVCDQLIDWENPKILDTMTGKNKTALYFDIRLRESLWIAKENSGPGHGLNEDWGGHLRTRTWLPVFEKM